MKRTFTLTLFLLFSVFSNAQNFTGQWKGGFVDGSSSFVGFGGERIEYVLDLETNGTLVTGYSYTYFVEGGKRFYTICKLRGKINRKTKEVIVTEYERTKYNTPPDFRNCFQTHKLTYFKNGVESESLEGTWIPAPDQDGDCGYGKTYLTRRLLKKIVPFQDRSTAKTPSREKPFKDMNRQTPPVQSKTNTTKLNPPVTSTTPLSKKKIEKITPPVTKNNTVVKDKPVAKNDKPAPKDDASKTGSITDMVLKESNTKIPEMKNEQKIVTPSIKFEKRTNKVLKTIEVEKETITVDLYDNGEIDGDTVSVFYNGKLLLSNKRLSDKPLSLKLEIDKEREENELTMYAENLGEIPPNTALMVVKDGENRYEVRITSDTQKNGTIAFVHKDK